MDWYVKFVENYPLLSSVVQFAILGTVGEILSKVVSKQKIFGISVMIRKAIVWAALAVMIKYAFVGFFGFPDALVGAHLLPAAFKNVLFLKAFTVSAFTNLFFGPVMIYSHRFMDNVLMGTRNYSNMKGAIWTLVWFWIPAHTVTFSLPVNFQITLATVWSVVLGLILGYFSTKNSPAKR